MRRIEFELGLFRDGEGERAYSERALELLVRALVEADVAYLSTHRAPPLYRSGVRLSAACSGAEDEWRGVESVLAHGTGDNVSLACWRCAERIVRGEAARPVVRWLPFGDAGAYYVLLAGADGVLEDPASVVFEAEHGAPISLALGRPDLHTPSSRVAITTRLFHTESERPYSERVLATLLRALTAANVLYLRTHRAPPLYASGVRYKAERFPREEWQGFGTLVERGAGDCEDLACARSAELIAHGYQVAPTFRFRRVGRVSVYHILVRYADGHIEDPSLLLGMGQHGATLADLGLPTRRRGSFDERDAQGERAWERC